MAFHGSGWSCSVMLYDLKDVRRESGVIKKSPRWKRKTNLRKHTKKSLGGVKAKKIVAEPSHQRFYANINPFLGDDWLEQTGGAHLATIKINISSNAVVNAIDDRCHMEKKSDGHSKWIKRLSRSRCNRLAIFSVASPAHICFLSATFYIKSWNERLTSFKAECERWFVPSPESKLLSFQTEFFTLRLLAKENSSRSYKNLWASNLFTITLWAVP